MSARRPGACLTLRAAAPVSSSVHRQTSKENPVVKLNVRSLRSVARGLGVATAAAVLAAPAAVAAPDPGALHLAPGVGTATLWDASTVLTDSNGQAAASLQAGNRIGVSSVKFSPLGEALVAEKGGRLVYFRSQRAHSGTVLTTSAGSDLSSDTLASSDLGLGGIAFDPQWPRRPYVYALHTANDKLPPASGKWLNSDCSYPSKCAVQSKLERLTIGQRWVGGHFTPYIKARKTLVQDWCTLGLTHAVGDIRFDRSGYLLASAGDGSLEVDAPADIRAACGAHRDVTYAGNAGAQDALDADVAPSLNGKIIRIDPDTGAGAPGNPWASSSDANRRRIIALGFRNPYRMVLTPGGSSLMVGMIGYQTRESLWTIPLAPRLKTVLNAGWPCSEAGARPNIPAAADPICSAPSRLPATALQPTLTWQHDQPLDPNGPCPASSPSAAMGVAYAPRSRAASPDYRGSLIFSDYGLGCVWSKKQGAAPTVMAMFDRHTIRALETAPNGEVTFADYLHGSIRKFTFAGARPRAPHVAVLGATLDQGIAFLQRFAGYFVR